MPANSAIDELSSLPPVWPHELRDQICRTISDYHQKLVVIDDDPTGTQTVYDVPVITRWDENALRKAIQQSSNAFYVLTNSRSLPEPDAAKINHDIGRSLREISNQTGIPVCMVSRSDSTLRGHFPAETDALTEGFEETIDATFVIPYFGEGGRITICNVHYVHAESQLTPAADTPFAQDKVFGYRHSNLAQWIEEKSKGRVAAADVAAIDIDDVRRGGPEAVYAKLINLPPGSMCVVNAVADRDLDVFVTALLRAEKQGRRYLFRTAASFVAARLGLAHRDLLPSTQLINPHSAPGAGGLVIVGSHVPMSTKQLERLLELEFVKPMELDVRQVVKESADDYIIQSAGQLNSQLASGRCAVLFTSRELLTADTDERNLQISQQISQALVDVVKQLDVRPRFVISKGGITSSDIATKALKVEQAKVLGQAMTGVPVWQLGDESRFPKLPYVVFPGNVGQVETLADLVANISTFAAT